MDFLMNKDLLLKVCAVSACEISSQENFFMPKS